MEQLKGKEDKGQLNPSAVLVCLFFEKCEKEVVRLFFLTALHVLTGGVCECGAV